MQVGRGAGSDGSAETGRNAHPLGGPPGQMWKQAIAEGQAEGSQVRIPPGQQKKLGRQEGATAQAPDEEAARASLNLDNLPPGLRMLVALAGPANSSGTGPQAGGR